MGIFPCQYIQGSPCYWVVSFWLPRVWYRTESFGLSSNVWPLRQDFVGIWHQLVILANVWCISIPWGSEKGLCTTYSLNNGFNTRLAHQQDSAIENVAILLRHDRGSKMCYLGIYFRFKSNVSALALVGWLDYDCFYCSPVHIFCESPIVLNRLLQS